MSIINRIREVFPERTGVGNTSPRNAPVVAGSLFSEESINSTSESQDKYAKECHKRIVEMSLVAQLETQGVRLSKISVEVLGLCTRASKRLRRANILTMQQLVNCTEGDLVRIDGLGILTLTEIESKIRSYLANVSSRGSCEPDTAGLNEEFVDPSLLQSIECQRISLCKTSIQMLGLTEQESGELRMFNINTVQELVNCAKRGFFSIPDLEITSVEEIKKKLNSYLMYLSGRGNQDSDTPETSKKIVRTSLQPINLTSRQGVPIIEHQSEIAEPLLLMQLEEQGIDLNTIGVEWLDVSVRASKRLRIANIANLQHLVDCSRNDLLSIYGLGVTTIEEIKDKTNTCLWRILDKTALGEQAKAQAKQISEQLLDLISHLCRIFKDCVPLNEIDLPYFAQQRLCKAIGKDPKTLADLEQLISILGQHEQIYYEIHALEQAVDCLHKILTCRNVDSEVTELIQPLDDREYFILTNRFGIRKNLTLEMVGEQFRVTRERARQIESKMRAKLSRMVARSELMYSIAGIALIERLGEDATVDSWIQRLLDIGFLKEEASADLLVAISRVTNTTPLTLPKEFDRLLEPHISPRILWAEKPVLNEARRFCRISGAVRAISLTSERISGADVEQILSLNAFTEVYPGWWMKKGNKCVPEGVARKVIAYCGTVSTSNLRQALTKHLSRFRFSAPPSEVLVAVLEQTGNFTLVDGFVKLISLPTRKPSLTRPESIFVENVQSEGPVISFELLRTEIVEEGFSVPSVTSLLHYSPIVEKITFGLYTLLGTPYNAGDVERAKSQVTRVSADTSMKPRPDGVIEFETNIGTWTIYSGVLNSGPAASLEGRWTLVADGEGNTELVVGGGFIRGFSDVVAGLCLMPMDRIRIEFNTWTREARITKVANYEQI